MGTLRALSSTNLRASFAVSAASTAPRLVVVLFDVVIASVVSKPWPPTQHGACHR
jgi:hypothetical protein